MSKPVTTSADLLLHLREASNCLQEELKIVEGDEILREIGMQLQSFLEYIQTNYSREATLNQAIFVWEDQEDGFALLLFPARPGDSPGTIMGMPMAFDHAHCAWGMLWGDKDRIWYSYPLNFVDKPKVTEVKLTNLDSYEPPEDVVENSVDLACTIVEELTVEMWRVHFNQFH
ncbi:MAG: hypothetical protein OEY01_03640 [Desulfobulbaceae bacterium]|nr:hypothetical protein [Desulfobulbaceae bacterium]